MSLKGFKIGDDVYLLDYDYLANKPFIDSALSDSSENAAQNKAIKAAVDEKYDADGNYPGIKAWLAHNLVSEADLAAKLNAYPVIPNGPTTNGSYYLQCVVADGVKIYSWSA